MAPETQHLEAHAVMNQRPGQVASIPQAGVAAVNFNETCEVLKAYKVETDCKET